MTMESTISLNILSLRRVVPKEGLEKKIGKFEYKLWIITMKGFFFPYSLIFN